MLLSLAKNPLLLSVFVGLAIAFFRIDLPEFADKTIKLFADSVTAVVLFSLGLFLGIQKTGKLKDWLQIALLTIVTMMLLPYTLFLVIRWIPMDTTTLKSIILDAAMPLGVTPYVLSVQYKLETTLLTRVVVFGTLLSVVVIPFWMALL